MTERMQNLVEPKKYNALFEIFKIFVIPAITAVLLYYGAFVEIKKDVQYLVKTVDKLELNVEKHHADREIHVPHIR
jgi:hypothetical protein